MPGVAAAAVAEFEDFRRRARCIVPLRQEGATSGKCRQGALRTDSGQAGATKSAAVGGWRGTGSFAGRDVTQVVDQELRVEAVAGSGLHNFVQGLFPAAGVEFLLQECTRGRSPARAKSLVHGALNLTCDHMGQHKTLKIDGIRTVQRIISPDGSCMERDAKELRVDAIV